MANDRSANPDTRVMVMEAAVSSILDLGYYRASSNEIARRAGVTWGVIQHYFGTREQLLLAALRHAVESHSRSVQTATITGETLAERLTSYAEILHEYYASAPFLAHWQIAVNLLADPQTADDTIQAMEATLAKSRRSLTKLLAQATSPLDLTESDSRLVFSMLRGIALEDLVVRSMHPHRKFEPVEQLLAQAAEALATYLTARSRPITGGRKPRRG